MVAQGAGFLPLIREICREGGREREGDFGLCKVYEGQMCGVVVKLPLEIPISWQSAWSDPAV